MLRQSLRSLRRSPAYAASAIGSVAIGLALATATFAFITTVTGTGKWFPDAERVYFARLKFGDRRNRPSGADQLELIKTLPGLEAAAVTMPAGIGDADLQRLPFAYVQAVSPEFWAMYGIKPVRGRLPTEQDLADNHAILVSETLWAAEFPPRATLTDARLRIGDRMFDIIGIVPSLMSRHMGIDVFVPFKTHPSLTSRVLANANGVGIILKFRRGYTPDRLRPELDRVASALSAAFPTGASPKFRLDLAPAISPRGEISSMETLLYFLGFGILAIGCTNVSALTLARGMTRRRDYALRMALGASRASIGAVVFAEVAAVTVIGGAIGVGVAAAAVGVLRAITPTALIWRGLPLPEFNASAFSFSLMAMLVAVIIGGALPAWRAARVAPNEPLKDGAGTTTGRSRGQFRALIIGELAMAMVLLMMASLVTLSLRNIAEFDYGFAPQSIVSVTVAPRTRNAGRISAAERRALRDRTLEAFETMPGMGPAALAGGIETVPGRQVVSDRSAAGEPVLSTRTYVTAGAGYLTALGVRLAEGRDFEEGDATAGAAVLSRRAATVLFPRGGAVGHSVKLGPADHPGSFIRIVGVSEDFSLSPNDDPENVDPLVLVVANDTSPTAWHVIGRTTRPAATLQLPLQKRVTDLLPPGWRVGAYTMSEQLDMQISLLAYFTKIFAALGGVAVALGALGVFSVLSYVVGQREREFAVRVSLGATPANLVRVVMGSAFEFALGGTAVGALLSFWASAGVSDLLFGVKNTDPVSLIVTESVLIGATLLAALGPALRASRANPLDVMRAV